MLKVTIPGGDEEWDDVKQEFLPPAKDTTITLEHSLYTISLWEAKWEKPYLGMQKKTAEEMLDYIKCMTIEDVDDNIFDRLTPENQKVINDYIVAPMTATTIQNPKKSPSRKVTTSEELYYQMIALHIPVEFEHWHLNRLLTLIQVCSIKSDPNPKKMSRAEMARQRASLNAKRRAALKSRG